MEFLKHITMLKGLLTEYAFFFDFIALLLLYIVIRTVIKFSRRTAGEAVALQQHIDYSLISLQATQKEKVMEASTALSLGLRQYFGDKLDNVVETLTAELSAYSTKENQKLKTDLESAIRSVVDDNQGIRKQGENLEKQVEEVRKNRELMEQQTLYLHDKFAELQSMVASQKESASPPDEKLRADFVTQLSEQTRQDRTLLQESIAESNRLISSSIDRLTGEVDAKLELMSDRLKSDFSQNMADGMAETVASFHSLQKQIDAFMSSDTELGTISRDLGLLSRMILATDKTEVTQGRLTELLNMTLPEEAYVLGGNVNGHSTAAILNLPGNEGAIAIDNNLSHGDLKDIMQDADMLGARRDFDYTLRAHINYVADTFIPPPEMAETAILFIQSEILYSEIQAHHREAVDLAMQRRVWMVSPTSLIAVLNMARGLIKDYQARLQLEHMREAMEKILEEARNFENRLVEIGDHVSQAMRSVQRAENASSQFFGQVRGAAGKTSGHIDISAALKTAIV